MACRSAIVGAVWTATMRSSTGTWIEPAWKAGREYVALTYRIERYAEDAPQVQSSGSPADVWVGASRKWLPNREGPLRW